MHESPDIEVIFEFTGTYSQPLFDGCRPVHQITENYLTSGVHHYFGKEIVQPDERIKGTIKFVTPEAYPGSCWIGKRIKVLNGPVRLIGWATVTQIFNPILLKSSDQ